MIIQSLLFSDFEKLKEGQLRGDKGFGSSDK
jgi:hypothetical protein